MHEDVVVYEAPPVPAAPAVSIFGDEPAKAWARMQELANIFKEVVAASPAFIEALPFKERGGKERVQQHVTIEGWVALGALVGITARVRWVARVEGKFPAVEWSGPKGNRKKREVTKDGHGYSAMAEAVTLSGAVVAAREGLCLSVEDRWESADEYARKSMAQTRACSQAIATVLRPIVEMAGFKGTPSEEMQGVVDRQAEERRVEGPARVRYGGWKDLFAALDQAMQDEGAAKGWLTVAALAQDGLSVTKPSDLGDQETKDRYFAALHMILYALHDAAKEAPGGSELYKPTQDELLAMWREQFPKLSAKWQEQSAAEGGGDAPTGDFPPDPDGAADIPFGSDYPG